MPPFKSAQQAPRLLSAHAFTLRKTPARTVVDIVRYTVRDKLTPM